MKRISFDEIWFNLACDLAQRSECKRLKVGSVLVNSETNKIISIGYNGGPSKQNYKCSGLKGDCGCLHSEQNCLLSSNSSYNSPQTLYLTHSPCKYCATAIVNYKSIKRVLYIVKYRDRSGINILRKAGIKVIMYLGSK